MALLSEDLREVVEDVIEAAGRRHDTATQVLSARVGPVCNAAAALLDDLATGRPVPARELHELRRIVRTLSDDLPHLLDEAFAGAEPSAAGWARLRAFPVDLAVAGL